jgi:hypothetical protein
MTIQMHAHRDSKFVRKIYSDFETLEITDYEGNSLSVFGTLGQFKDYPIPVEYVKGYEPKEETANVL